MVVSALSFPSLSRCRQLLDGNQRENEDAIYSSRKWSFVPVWLGLISMREHMLHGEDGFAGGRAREVCQVCAVVIFMQEIAQVIVVPAKRLLQVANVKLLSQGQAIGIGGVVSATDQEAHEFPERVIGQVLG